MSKYVELLNFWIIEFPEPGLTADSSHSPELEFPAQAWLLPLPAAQDLKFKNSIIQ